MRLEILDIINLITIVQLFIFILFLIDKKHRHLANCMLALFLFTQAFGILNYTCMRHLEITLAHPDFIFLLGDVRFLWGPVLYLYVQALTVRNYRLSWKHLFHGLPYCLSLIYLFFNFHFQGIAIKRMILEDIVTGHYYSRYWILSILTLQILIYNIASLLILRLYNKRIKEQYSSIEKLNLSWLRFFIFGYIISYFISSANALIFQSTSHWSEISAMITFGAFFLFFNIIFYKGLVQPDIFSGLAQKSKYQTLSLKPEQIELYLKIISDYMIHQEAYLKPGLTLNDMANDIHIAPRHISQLVNKQFSQNFYEYVNKYRIDHAIKILTDPSKRKMTILEILYESGFGTKSAFNKAFKNKTGLTPTKFRRQYLKSI